MMKFLYKYYLFFFVMALFACSSSIPVAELSSTTDPSVEIERLDSEMATAVGDQVDILSPSNFKKATESLVDAKEKRKNNDRQKSILHSIAVSEAYLKMAIDTAALSNQILLDVVSERRNAIIAEAPKYMEKEFTLADNELRKVTRAIESNDTGAAVRERVELQGRYSDIEVKSIIQVKLGDAKAVVKQSQSEGAQMLVPQILSWAQSKIHSDEVAIMEDRHNLVAVERACADANTSAQRLLDLTRQAKIASVQNPEQLAVHLEQDKNAAKQSEKKLVESNSDLEEEKGNIAALSESNEMLKSEARMEKKYESARETFSSSEADVYKQGDKILLRLKGLSFPRDQAAITSSNYPLLAKVQAVIKDIGPGEIVVEGHTDSTGSKRTNDKLSTARAESVVEYLKANTLMSDSIEAKGLGDSKPIATNKTPMGRAQNRRVDVIISSTEAE